MTDSLRRLLVVDDERIQRLIVTRVAESIGFIVDGAADLDAAAEWLARRRYDAIVLDLSLGAREGVSLLHMLRGGGADPLVVLISGMDARVRAPSCRQAKALDLRLAGAMAKPIVPATLRDVPRRAEHQVAGALAADEAAPVAVPSVAELAEALERGNITVAFQPKVGLIGRQVVGLEVFGALAAGGARAGATRSFRSARRTPWADRATHPACVA
jgi:DNA-binding response OmpR family regulator